MRAPGGLFQACLRNGSGRECGSKVGLHRLCGSDLCRSDQGVLVGARVVRLRCP